MSRQLGITKFEVAGRLMAVWEWADANVTEIGPVATSATCPQNVRTESGQMSAKCPQPDSGIVRMACADCAFIDDIAGLKNFGEAMVSVGWLVTDGNQLVFPRFARHNGKHAKRRAYDAELKNSRRSPRPQSVRTPSGQVSAICPHDVRTNVRTESGLEKRREEKNESNRKAQHTVAGGPANADAPRPNGRNTAAAQPALIPDIDQPPPDSPQNDPPESTRRPTAAARGVTGLDLPQNGPIDPTRIAGVRRGSDLPPVDERERAVRAEDLRVAWNAMALEHELPTVQSLNDSRRKKINARLKESFFRANWRQALAAIPTKGFLVGRLSGSRGPWKADFEFFIRPSSVERILEGKYDDSRFGRPGNDRFHYEPDDGGDCVYDDGGHTPTPAPGGATTAA